MVFILATKYASELFATRWLRWSLQASTCTAHRQNSLHVSKKKTQKKDSKDTTMFGESTPRMQNQMENENESGSPPLSWSDQWDLPINPEFQFHAQFDSPLWRE